MEVMHTSWNKWSFKKKWPVWPGIFHSDSNFCLLCAKSKIIYFSVQIMEYVSLTTHHRMWITVLSKLFYLTIPIFFAWHLNTFCGEKFSITHGHLWHTDKARSRNITFIFTLVPLGCSLFCCLFFTYTYSETRFSNLFHKNQLSQNIILLECTGPQKSFL